MLVEPVRRALYDYVRHQDHPVTREEAATAQSISRNLTAFHLDKLVEGRLLVAHCGAPADHRRGRGRTPKVYEAIDDDLSITIPPRRYELVGEILADAVAEQPGDASEAALRLAFEHGLKIGQQSLSRTGPRAAGRQPELVCGLNHSFVSGLLAGLNANRLVALLRARPASCCVVVSAEPAAVG